MIKIRYENEIPQLRWANIVCPDCEVEFNALENGKTEQAGRIHDYIDLQYAVFKCPNCNNKFTTRDQNLDLKEGQNE